MGALVDHARRELELCGQTAEDPAYADALVRAVEAFASYGHSGGSAMVAIGQLHDLLRYRTLAPLTSDPAEWEDRSEISNAPLWQNRRDPAAMSTDGGKTWHFVDEREGPVPASSLHHELRGLLNQWSAENGSDTPDDTLAAYLLDCLAAFDRAVKDRSTWYGRHDQPGAAGAREYDRGGDLPPGLTVAVNRTGRTERFGTSESGG